MDGPVRERGSATVAAIGVIGVIVSLLVAGLLLGGVVAAVHRAAAAADLGALAGAGVVGTGGAPGAACAAAAGVVRANGGVVDSCAVAGQDVLVEVEVPTPRGIPWPALGRARAGPPRTTGVPAG